mgnify:CR=1 FL=1
MTEKQRRHLHIGQIRAILERAIATLADDSLHAELADDVHDVLANVCPDCPGCKAIHESYPTMHHFHHPGCPDKDKCAMCGDRMETEPSEEEKYFRIYWGCQVGGICGKCYDGRDVKNGDVP